MKVKLLQGISDKRIGGILYRFSHKIDINQNNK